MKKSLAIILFLFFSTITTAQVWPEAFIGKFPSVPANICSEDNTQAKDEFMAKLNEIGESLQNEIDRRKENNDAKSHDNKLKMMDNAIKQSGISPDLIQKLMNLEKQSKGATGDQKKAFEAQKRAIADEMMQQKMNISMGEVDNLKKTNVAGRKAWATGYTTEMKAEADADPKRLQDQNAKNMQRFKLMNQQKNLRDSLDAQQNKYMNKFLDVDKDENGVRLLEQIDRVRTKIYELYTEAAKREMSPDPKTLAALKKEMVTAKRSYCALLTPKYIDALASYKSFTQSSLDALYRLEKLTNEVAESQTGVKLNTEPGAFGLSQVSGYMQRLRTAYKYNLSGPEDLMIGYNK